MSAHSLHTLHSEDCDENTFNTAPEDVRYRQSVRLVDRDGVAGHEGHLDHQWLPGAREVLGTSLDVHEVDVREKLRPRLHRALLDKTRHKPKMRTRQSSLRLHVTWRPIQEAALCTVGEPLVDGLSRERMLCLCARIVL